MNKSKILVIDDDKTNVELLVNLLEKKYDIKVSYNGKLGIKIAKQVIPDLIILDINMPETDGFEVAHDLKCNDSTKDIPIIFLTSNIEKETIITALDSGAADYISKPFIKEELLIRVSNHVKIRLMQKELQNRTKIQEQLLIQQSKLASMGEMMGSIAHQWRQPLTVLGGILMNLEDKYLNNELTSDYFEAQINSAEENILYMSKTIDDFKNFFIPSKTKDLFNIQDCINDAMKIVSSSLNKYNIKIDISNTKESSFIVNGYKNEFTQVLINIISNAKDSILDNSITNGHITIDLHEEEDEILICICDNGGGISIDIIDKIFDPYFTTKEEGKGTGIGLYMSKTIIENNMQGKLLVKNLNNGVCFKIYMKKYK